MNIWAFTYIILNALIINENFKKSSAASILNYFTLMKTLFANFEWFERNWDGLYEIIQSEPFFNFAESIIDSVLLSLKTKLDLSVLILFLNDIAYLNASISVFSRLTQAQIISFHFSRFLSVFLQVFINFFNLFFFQI